MLSTAVLCELAARLYWKTVHGVPAVRESEAVFRFYPELRFVAQPLLDPPDENIFDVLLLGGSTLHHDFSAIEHMLAERLTRELHGRVRIWNVSVPGDTSRDSWVKYSLLGAHHYDAVVFYNGINESRTNNVPDSVFRPDYSHMLFYELVSDLVISRRLRPFYAPYTLTYLYRQMQVRTGARSYLPMNVLPDSTFQFGADLKSPDSFEHNVRAIVALARERSDPLFLVTYAYHLDPSYTDEGFGMQRLDYTLHTSPARLWGRPENIVAAVEAHNERLRSVARELYVPLVDAAVQIPGSAETFNDIAHLTVEGSQLFSDLVVDAILASRGIARSSAPTP